MTTQKDLMAATPASGMTRRHVLMGAAAFGMSATYSIRVAAQAYPSQNILLVVPFTPGGSTDILARLLGQRLEVALKYPVIIEFRPGAGGSVGVGSVARAAADGHTLVMGISAPLPSIRPSIRSCPTIR